MTTIDIIILAVLALAGLMGYRKGLISQVIIILALLVGVWAAIHLSSAVGGMLVENFAFARQNTMAWSLAITFLLAVVGVFILGRFVEKALQAIHLNLVNRLLGFALGVVKGLLLVSMVLTALEFGGVMQDIDRTEDGKEALLVGPVRAFAPTIYPSLKEYGLRAMETIRSTPIEDTTTN